MKWEGIAKDQSQRWTDAERLDSRLRRTVLPRQKFCLDAAIRPRHRRTAEIHYDSFESLRSHAKKDAGVFYKRATDSRAANLIIGPVSK